MRHTRTVSCWFLEATCLCDGVAGEIDERPDTGKKGFISRLAFSAKKNETYLL